VIVYPPVGVLAGSTYVTDAAPFTTVPDVTAVPIGVTPCVTAKVTVPSLTGSAAETVASSNGAWGGSSARVGSGRGTHPCAGGATGTDSRAASNSTVAMSTPEMPSTSAWWVFESSAKRSPCKPSTSHSSQSGLERSSDWEKTRPARRLSCTSPPGLGRAVWRTWKAGLK